MTGCPRAFYGGACSPRWLPAAPTPTIPGTAERPPHTEKPCHRLSQGPGRPPRGAPGPRRAGCSDIFMRELCQGPGSPLSRGESGSCLSDGEPAPWTAESTRPRPRRLTKPCFPNTGSPSPLSASRWQSWLLGNAVYLHRGQSGDCIMPSPACLCKHLQGPPIKALLSSSGRCLL